MIDCQEQKINFALHKAPLSIKINLDMSKPVSRLLVFFLTFLMALSLSVRPAQASIWDWIKAQFQSKEASENMETSITQEGVSGEKHVTETTSNLMNVINLHVLGSSQDEATESSMLRQSVGPGLIGTVNSGIVAMYDPPISSRTYVADLLQNAKIIPQAQAQGLGFSSLDPILETWKNFRNIAYLFFVIIFLIIGFMIMFRAKVGQAAITVQQAIPSIVVALLAVTFSYAIAGFLIDIMYVSMYLILSLFDGQGTDLITGNIFTLVGAMFSGFGNNVRNAMQDLMAGLLGEGFVSAALGWLSSLSAIMIIGLAILFSVFKIFLELLKSYIAIILQVVFSPVILMVGAIPGQNTFLSWIKNLTGNLVMWPLTLICLLVNRMLTNSAYVFNDAQIGGFMPPYLLGTGQGAAFPALVGIGILLVIPEIMKEAKKKLGVSEGVMGNLAGAAFKQLKQGWNVGKPIVGAGVSMGTGGIGGLVGGISGFAKGDNVPIKDRFRNAGQSALKGAGIGAAVPTVITKAPKFIKGTIDTTISQSQEALSKRAMGKYDEYKKGRETGIETSQEEAILAEQKRQLKSRTPGSSGRGVSRFMPSTQQPNSNSSQAKSQADSIVGE